MSIYDKEKNIEIVSTVNGLARMCLNIASEHGFDEDEAQITHIIEDANRIGPRQKRDLLNWFDATTEQAEIARMHSELSEWLERVRKEPAEADSHIPQFENRVVEAADTIIRIFHTCAKRDYPIGQAVLAKMEYNNSRPHKHGKNS